MGALAWAWGQLYTWAVKRVVRHIGWCDRKDALLQVALWVGVCARLEKHLLPYGSLVWVQVVCGRGWWMCGCGGRWRPLVLVALEWLRVRMQIDRTPWADVVVSLGVLEVKDFKDGAEGVVRWGWAYVTGLAWVDGAWGGWLVGVGEDGLEVRAEGRW